MKIGATLVAVLIFVLAYRTSFCQQKLAKDEILKNLTANQKPISKDSLFRFDIHVQTRATLDKILMNGVDTLVVYSVSYPGYSEIDSDSCSTMYPVFSYFFWRRQGKDFEKKVTGKCERGQSTTNDKVIRFVLDNFPKITTEFFMRVTYGVVADGDKMRILRRTTNHEPKHKILLQLGDQFKCLSFTESELTDKKSLFRDHNRSLTSYKLFRLIKNQIKKG
jgi:hypothetical protein